MTEFSNFELIRLTAQDMLNVMSNTQRCDKVLAEAAVKNLYISSCRKPPETFLWFQSPLDAVPVAMICAWMESGRLVLSSQRSRVSATIKANDATLSEFENTADSTPLTVQEDDLFPITPLWRSWLGNLDLNEDSICFVRTILRNDQLPRPHAAYRDEVERLTMSATIIRRSIERSARRYLTHQFKQKSPAQFFTETIDYMNNATTNSTFLEELNRAGIMLDRLTERDQRFVRECLISFIYSGSETNSTESESLKFRFGQHDADHASERLFANWMVGPVDHAEEIAEVTRTCGWWCPFPNVCIMIDRPVEIHLDQRGMLHNTEGPSCLYADGLGFFSLRGVGVPQWIAEGKFDLKQIIEETNAEWRRVMIDRYGVERYLQETAASMISHDQYGRLFRISLGQGQDPLMLVEVRNSTPEPDGSYKLYFLRVPPTMTTAREAVAWTFSMEGDYNPSIES